MGEPYLPVSSWAVGSEYRTKGGVAEWFRQGPAKPRTAVRFRSPPLRTPCRPPSQAAGQNLSGSLWQPPDAELQETGVAPRGRGAMDHPGKEADSVTALDRLPRDEGHKDTRPYSTDQNEPIYSRMTCAGREKACICS
jgi:hypothetical protein